MGFVVTMITVLIAFVLIAGVVFRFMSETESKEAEILCQNSVVLRAATSVSLGSLEDVKAAPILCKTIDQKIKGNKNEVKKELADMMARCWWMFNEGRTPNLLSSLPGLGGKNKGFVCYTAIVEESKDFKGSDSITDFDVFLRDKSYPKMKNTTYLQYIQYRSGGPGRITMILPQEGNSGVIKPNRAFEIAFIEKKSDSNAWISTVLMGGGAVVGVAGAIVLALPTGGTSLIAVGAVIGGVALAGTGGVIEYQKLFEERDVNTIMVLDMSNNEIVNEFHKNVFMGDIASE